MYTHARVTHPAYEHVPGVLIKNFTHVYLYKIIRYTHTGTLCILFVRNRAHVEWIFFK